MHLLIVHHPDYIFAVRELALSQLYQATHDAIQLTINTDICKIMPAGLDVERRGRYLEQKGIQIYHYSIRSITKSVQQVLDTMTTLAIAHYTDSPGRPQHDACTIRNVLRERVEQMEANMPQATSAAIIQQIRNNACKCISSILLLMFWILNCRSRPGSPG
jgi:hypothetical protein